MLDYFFININYLDLFMSAGMAGGVLKGGGGVGRGAAKWSQHSHHTHWTVSTHKSKICWNHQSQAYKAQFDRGFILIEFSKIKIVELINPSYAGEWLRWPSANQSASVTHHSPFPPPLHVFFYLFLFFFSSWQIFALWMNVCCLG